MCIWWLCFSRHDHHFRCLIVQLLFFPMMSIGGVQCSVVVDQCMCMCVWLLWVGGGKRSRLQFALYLVAIAQDPLSIDDGLKNLVFFHRRGGNPEQLFAPVMIYYGIFIVRTIFWSQAQPGGQNKSFFLLYIYTAPQTARRVYPSASEFIGLFYFVQYTLKLCLAFEIRRQHFIWRSAHVANNIVTHDNNWKVQTNSSSTASSHTTYISYLLHYQYI